MVDKSKLLWWKWLFATAFLLVTTLCCFILGAFYLGVFWLVEGYGAGIALFLLFECAGLALLLLLSRYTKKLVGAKSEA